MQRLVRQYEWLKSQATTGNYTLHYLLTRKYSNSVGGLVRQTIGFAVEQLRAIILHHQPWTARVEPHEQRHVLNASDTVLWLRTHLD